MNTADSGLRQKAVQSEEKMGHLEEDSKENKNMLYGNARKAMSQRYRPNNSTPQEVTVWYENLQI